MKKKARRDFTPQEKVSILKQHLLEEKLVLDVCDAHGLNPTQLRWWSNTGLKDPELPTAGS